MAEEEKPFSKIVEQVMSAARKSAKKTPEQIERQVRKTFADRANAAEKNVRIIENAKAVVAESKTQGVHVSTGLHEWVGRNKFSVLDEDPAQAFKIAKADLAVALKAAPDLPDDHWVRQAALRVKNAESAQALQIIALTPKDVRDNPNFIFQTAAQLGGSNLDPETQITTKAFVAELKTLRGVDGFEMSDNQLEQALTEKGIAGVSAPLPDVFLGVDFSKLPESVKEVFRALNEDLSAAGLGKLGKATLKNREIIARNVLGVLRSYDLTFSKIETPVFDKDQNRLFAELQLLKNNIEFSVTPTQSIDARTLEIWAGLPKGSVKGSLSTRFSKETVQFILQPGKGEEIPSGADLYYEMTSDRIFTSGREARQPDLDEMYEYGEFKTILRHVFGDNTPLITTYQERWMSDFQRNVPITRVLSGAGGEKELIQLRGNIPTDTLNNETRIKYAPESIRNAELLLCRLSAEERYWYDRNVEYVTTQYINILNDKGVKEFQEKFSKPLNRAQVWREFSTRRAELFPGNNGEEFIKMEVAMRAGHGSMVHDIWMTPNMPEFVKLSSLTQALESEIVSKLKPNMTVAQKASVRDAVLTPYKERLKFLWHKVTLKDTSDDKLLNMDLLEKIRGFAPYEIELFKQLEMSHPDANILELRKAILAQRRFLVGSQRMVSLVGSHSNMPGLEFAPSGDDVMIESLEYGMRTDQAERFIFNRFGFGKEKIGKRIMAKLMVSLAGLRGVVLDKKGTFFERIQNFGKQMLKDPISPGESIPMREYRTSMKKIRKAYGVGYTQLALGTFLDANCVFDYSQWRLARAVVGVLNEKYGPDAENQALCFRLALTGTKGKYDVKKGEHGPDYYKRTSLVDKIIHKEPSVLLLNLGSSTFDQKVLKDNGIIPGTAEWDKFISVLGRAEHRVFTERVLFHETALNLGESAWFDKVFTSEVFTKAGVSTAEISTLKVKYLKTIQDIQNVFKTKQPDQIMSSADMWKEYGMPSTLSITDFDLSEADFKLAGESAQQRGDIGDPGSRLEARNVYAEMIKNPEIALPEEVKKTLIPAMVKLNDQIIGYKDTDFTERRVVTIADAVLSQINPSDIYRGWVQAIPFLPGLMRWVVGQDVRKGWVKTLLEPARYLSVGVAKLTGQPELADLLTHNVHEWPEIFGQEFISGAVGARGGKANTPMAIGLNEIIEEIEHSAVITNHNLLHDLRDKYKTRIGWRALEGGLRFWWIPPAAAIAVGVIIAMKEQGFDDHK